MNSILSDEICLSIEAIAESLSTDKQFIRALIHSNYLSTAKIQLHLRDVTDNTHLSELDFTIFENSITIDYLNSWVENCGYARRLVTCFRKISNIIIQHSVLDIKTIDGIIACKDYDNWDKSLHIYSSIYPKKHFLLDNKYTKPEFSRVMQEYKKNVLNVRFTIIL